MERRLKELYKRVRGQRVEVRDLGAPIIFFYAAFNPYLKYPRLKLVSGKKRGQRKQYTYTA